MTTNEDLESLSRAELTKLRADLDRAIAAAGDREKRAALKAAEAVMREHGFALADLMAQAGGSAGSGRGKGRSAAPATARGVRFRNPADHSQTWSGRGRGAVGVRAGTTRRWPRVSRSRT